MHNFQIEKLPNKKSFIKGYIGLTSDIVIAGVITFDCPNDSKTLMSLKISFQGLVSSKLTVSGNLYKESAIIYNEKSILLGGGSHPLAVSKGHHSLPFELTIHQPAHLSNYSSPQLGKSDDGASIAYKLEAEMELISGFFGGKRKFVKAIEPLDLPFIRLEEIIAAKSPQLLDHQGNLKDNIQVHVDLDSHILYIGSKVSVCVDAKGEQGITILDAKVDLLQCESILAQGQQRHYDFILCQGTDPSKCAVQDKTFRSIIHLKEQHIKLHHQPYRSIDVQSSFFHPLVSISHKIRISIQYSKNGKKEFGSIEIPFMVSELDLDMMKEVENYLAIKKQKSHESTSCNSQQVFQSEE